MNIKKLFGLLLLVVLLASATTWETTFAKSSVHEPPIRAKGAASSLIIGVPFEDAGNVQNAGVIDTILGVNSWGLRTDASANTYYSQATDNADTVEQGDIYGRAVVSGDFDGNDYYDIAIGVPGENNWMGAVNVIFFFSDRSIIQTITLEDSIIKQGAQAGDGFGSALVAGDFDGDGRDDLAVGAPGYDNDKGAVAILYGNYEALFYGEDIFAGKDGERFGSALARADFDANGIYDLVVGSPGAGVGSSQPDYSGKVTVFYGPLDNIFVPRAMWTQSSTGQGVSEPDDQFGASLATGDFNSDGRTDLAIGVPGEDRGSVKDTGAINILYNDHHDLSKTGAKVLFINPTHEGNRTGFSLAAGDFDNDGSDDLAIGSPYVDYNGVADAGRVDVIWGTPTNRGMTTLVPPDNRTQYMGYSLAAGDFSGFGFDSLVMGTPGYSSPGHSEDGAVLISLGSSDGLRPDPYIITQNDLKVTAAEDFDYFGYSLAVWPVHRYRSVLFTPIILH